MQRTRFEVIVGLGLIIFLLSVVPAFAAHKALPSSLDKAISQQPTQAEKERGQTNDEYGTLTMVPRAGMSETMKGVVRPDSKVISGVNEPTLKQLEQGQTSDEYGTLTLHARAGMHYTSILEL